MIFSNGGTIIEVITLNKSFKIELMECLSIHGDEKRGDELFEQLRKRFVGRPIRELECAPLSYAELVAQGYLEQPK